MEFVMGGLAACGACLFSNPADVVKTRMQLQGELMKKGLYTRHFRNVFHAFYVIARKDGILALQQGLVPALAFQFVMNGTRLGVYQTVSNLGVMGGDKELTGVRSVVAGALSGAIGGFVGSPLYLIKTHLQVHSEQIAVGHQHHHRGMLNAFHTIYNDGGIIGLWRGVSSALPRLSTGSGVQLSTFATSRNMIDNMEFEWAPRGSFQGVVIASMISGFMVSTCMTPFDVISTRMYNQGVSPDGKGLFYSGWLDCIIKTYTKEGFPGFYKGWSASFLRLGPHTVLTLVFWGQLRKLHAEFTRNK